MLSPLRAAELSAKDSNPDDALVQRVRAGEVPAFDAIYLAHYEALCAFVLAYVRSRAVAEEVVQDVLCHIWERRAAWTLGGSTLRGYLYCAARNAALNVVRRQRLEMRFEAEALASTDPPAGMGQSQAPPDITTERLALASALERAVQSLPGRCQEAIVLRWHHRLSRAETARVMGISLKGVEALLTRGVKLLREHLVGLM